MSGVRGFVGVTDNSWYQLLANRPDLLGEVNFWRPGGGGFQALRPGEPFFFKTHAPHNRVVGGGFFGGAARLPASEAWDLLGPANGAVSLEQMVDRITYYRREPRAAGEDPVIGCIFIRDVTFFPDDLTFDPPPDFSSNVVQGKTYDMGEERYSRYFGDLMKMVLGVARLGSGEGVQGVAVLPRGQGVEDVLPRLGDEGGAGRIRARTGPGARPRVTSGRSAGRPWRSAPRSGRP